MAHFAKIDKTNTVVNIIVIDNSEEHRGQEYINNDLNLEGKWIQSSYNTKGGIYYNPTTNEPSEDQSKALRKNPAGIGYIYDENRDAFIAPKPFDKWILNEDTCLWEAPIPYPQDGKDYVWNDNKGEWEEKIINYE